MKDNGDFCAGVGVRDITPSSQLVDNSLHCAMTVQTNEHGSPLSAKALALSYAGTCRVLVALDLIYMIDPAARMVREAIASATGVAVEEIVVCCSHSHSTPFIEPLGRPHPFLDLVVRQATGAAEEAVRSRQPAKIGHGTTYAVGASFNTAVPQPDGRAKLVRDFREGLASGRPIDPRLSVLRIDDLAGHPIAGWIRFAAHPANVIFNAPISAEYPGYMTSRLTELIDGAPPFLFGYGASGDVNCLPMFGRECDSRNLGHRLADLAADAFASIHTKSPAQVLSRSATIELPLDEPPSIETLDREIEEVETFIASLDRNPQLVWVLGFNCGEQWPIEKKRSSAQPLADWARQAKEMLLAGHRFPSTWTRPVTAWVIDDWGLVFDAGETFVEISLEIAARSPLAETLVLSMCNGADSYLTTDVERRHNGYRSALSSRYAMLVDGLRPLPCALGAASRYIEQILDLLGSIQTGHAVPPTA
jgi:neutral ceramidase